MSFRKKNNNQNARNRNVSNKDVAGVSTYSYLNARNDVDDTRDRNITRSAKSFTKVEFWLTRFGFVTLLIVSAICLVSILDLSSTPKVVVDPGATNTSLYDRYGASFVAKSSQLFSSSLLNHNKITVNTRSITETLERDFPEFGTISITLPLINHNPIIYVSPAVPVLVLSNSQGQYLLNQSGIAMLFSTSGFDYLDLPTVTDQSGYIVSPGQPALTSQDVTFIETVEAQLTAKHYQISSMTLPKDTSELDIHLTGEPFYIKFNLEDDNPKLQAGSFLATINYLNNQKVTPSQYIDVRSEGRVYYQ